VKTWENAKRTFPRLLDHLWTTFGGMILAGVGGVADLMMKGTVSRPVLVGGALVAIVGAALKDPKILRREV